MSRPSRTARSAPKLVVGAPCKVPAALADPQFRHKKLLEATVVQIRGVGDQAVVDLHFTIDDSIVPEISFARALKWHQAHCRQAQVQPSTGTEPTATGPAVTKRAAAAAKTPPAKKGKCEPETARTAPLPPATAAAAPPPVAREWSSPVINPGGGRTGSFEAIIDPSATPPHTLLLGTQPADTSLAKGWYFGTDENAFWHIVGHALKFRRGFHAHVRADGDVVPSIAAFLNPSHEVVREYGEAVRRLQGAGFALWDILESSVRKSAKTGRKTSMDSDIKKGKAARIEELVAAHPTIRRIVFVTGKASAKTFRDHFAGWLDRGGFCCANDAAFAVFGKVDKRAAAVPMKEGGGASGGIELIVPPSVSPAAARYDGDFGQKRDGWMRDVFSAMGGA